VEESLRIRKTLQELTIKDNFMFSAVMLDPENCQQLLERVLEIPIAHVEVNREKSIVYNPEYKGIRLDIIAKDEYNTHFNVEMQVQTQKLTHRSRYYHSQIDMELLSSGTGYKHLPAVYVIFICDFDPFGGGKYRYTVKKQIPEWGNHSYDDGSYSIFLSTKGTNKSEVSEMLVNFLEFVSADKEDFAPASEDAFVKRLKVSMKNIKADREMGARYMLLQELLDDERTAGREEGREEGRIEGRIEEKIESILECLEDFGPISAEIQNQIRAITNLETLKKLLRAASKAKTLDDFVTCLNQLQPTVMNHSF
jgi:predicted transposase/invertase (TIGR01784 family)